MYGTNINDELLIKTRDDKRIEKYLKMARNNEPFIFDDIEYKITNTDIREYSNSRVGLFGFREINVIFKK